MMLKKISYDQLNGTETEWRFEPLDLGAINLIVGKNASGKSRTLAVIDNYSLLLSGKKDPEYEDEGVCLTLGNGNQSIEYEIKVRKQEVYHERVVVSGEEKLIRGLGGVGRIYTEAQRGMMAFQAPANKLAAVVRQDAIQHAFLEPLKKWAESVVRYEFGGPFGRTTLAILVKQGSASSEEEGDKFDIRDTNQVLKVFRRGQRDFGESFTRLILEDMRSIGYKVTEASTMQPPHLKVEQPLPGEISSIYVREEDLKVPIAQIHMSQGMWRAMSIIIHANFAILSNEARCMLIDDFGEWLDFERASGLASLLVKKFEGSHSQLIMATNDRFIMNSVPLEYWTVLHRVAETVKFVHARNHSELFEKFKFTGLSNFDFFATEFFKEEA